MPSSRLSLYRDVSRRNTQEQVACPGILHPRDIRMTVKKKREFSSPARFYQAVGAGERINDIYSKRCDSFWAFCYTGARYKG